MTGWVKIHRKFQHWEWRDSPKHVAVFLDLLLEVNHKDKKYRGEIIKAGSLTTSYAAISNRTGVSIRGVRTVLKDLISTHEVTYKNCRHFSMISITNWESYQVGDTTGDNLMTSKRQPNDNLTTTNKNAKNVKNVKKGYKANYTPDDLVQYWNDKMSKDFAHSRGIGSGSYLRKLIETMNFLPNLYDWDEIFDKVKNTKQWNGKGDLTWKVNLIWLCDYDNVLKVLEYKEHNPLADFMKEIDV
jgi:hypothetical protein